MRIFLTGGTGYIGSAVLDAFVRAGHHVDALVRNSEKAERVQARGATPLLGDAADPSTYADAAAAADVVVLAAAEASPRGVKVDATTIDTVLSTPVRPGRVVIYTSGVWVLGPAPASVDETAPLHPIEHVAWRPAHEARVLDAATAGWRAIVIRPGIVYGGSSGIVGDLLKDASNSLIRVVGSGDNHWPLIYRDDLADLFVRLVAHPEIAGVVHATDGSDDTVNDLVEAMSSHVTHKPEVRHMSLADARHRMGALAEALAMDQIVRSPKALAIGWTPSLTSACRNVPRLLEERRDQVMGAG